MRARAAALCLVVAAPSAGAGEVLDVAVEQFGTRYVAAIDARFDVPAERLRALLTDYPNLGLINDSIQRSEVLETISPRHHCVRTEARVCVALLCKTIVQVQDVSQLPDGDILATVRASRSDFSYGVARWQFQEEAAGTRMRFRSEIEPAFWVPPLIGPWLIRHALQAEALESVANLERLAERQ